MAQLVVRVEMYFQVTGSESDLDGMSTIFVAVQGDLSVSGRGTFRGARAAC